MGIYVGAAELAIKLEMKEKTLVILYTLLIFHIKCERKNFWTRYFFYIYTTRYESILIFFKWKFFEKFEANLLLQ